MSLNLADISTMLRKLLLHAAKFYDMGPPALLPIRRKVSYGFLRVEVSKKPSGSLNSSKRSRALAVTSNKYFHRQLAISLLLD
jgi:hypothetical protein